MFHTPLGPTRHNGRISTSHRNPDPPVATPKREVARVDVLNTGWLGHYTEHLRDLNFDVARGGYLVPTYIGSSTGVSTNPDLRNFYVTTRKYQKARMPVAEQKAAIRKLYDEQEGGKHQVFWRRVLSEYARFE